MQTFYHGLTNSTRENIDAATGGAAGFVETRLSLLPSTIMIGYCEAAAQLQPVKTPSAISCYR